MRRFLYLFILQLVQRHATTLLGVDNVISRTYARVTMEFRARTVECVQHIVSTTRAAIYVCLAQHLPHLLSYSPLLAYFLSNYIFSDCEDTATCGGHGACYATGGCQCDSNHSGAHCDDCAPNYYGLDCSIRMCTQSSLRPSQLTLSLSLSLFF